MLAAAQIVAAIAALLAAVPAWATSVYTDRPWPLAEADLPAWRVFAADEEIISHGLNFPARQTHELSVLCHGFARETAGLQAELHAMASLALSTLFASKASSALAPINCLAMVLTRIDRDLVSEGEAALGRVALSLRVRFNTYSNAPEIII
jgi:hypothetical protein